ncbi:hypothetical protein [Streptomyces olivaceoviridis]|uniref:hypothetical protein n=1 Tax=Streptomyces olivaceoviridis TaxID=1921 RepID=UPI00367679C1
MIPGFSGASHPMAVNETVIAMLRPKPNLAKLTKESAEVRAAAHAAVDAPPGTLRLSGTCSTA